MKTSMKQVRRHLPKSARTIPFFLIKQNVNIGTDATLHARHELKGCIQTLLISTFFSLAEMTSLDAECGKVI
jgi:hypothetical protein